jgi:hypothetical protein
MAQTENKRKKDKLRYHKAKAQVDNYLSFKVDNPLSLITFKEWLQIKFYCEKV